SVPEASSAAAMVGKSGYLPVPRMRRDRKVLPATTRGSTAVVSAVASVVFIPASCLGIVAQPRLPLRRDSQEVRQPPASDATLGKSWRSSLASRRTRPRASASRASRGRGSTWPRSSAPWPRARAWSTCSKPIASPENRSLQRWRTLRTWPPRYLPQWTTRPRDHSAGREPSHPALSLVTPQGRGRVGRRRRLAGGGAVGVGDEDQGGAVAAGGLVVVVGIAGEDHLVAGAHLVGGGAVEADLAGAGAAGDGVGGQALAVGHVVDLDALEVQQVGGFHQ